MADYAEASRGFLNRKLADGVKSASQRLNVLMVSVWRGGANLALWNEVRKFDPLDIAQIDWSEVGRVYEVTCSPFSGR